MSSPSVTVRSTQVTQAQLLIRSYGEPIGQRFGYDWEVLESMGKKGKKFLKVGIKGVKIIKQGLEFAGFKKIALMIKLALMPVSMIRSMAFLISPDFTVDGTKLFGSSEDRRNLTVSFLAMTSALAPISLAYGLREKDEIDELVEFETGFLKIFSLEGALLEATEREHKVSKHIRVLDCVQALSDVAILLIGASQAPQTAAVLGAISFGIGIYTFSYPVINKVAQKALSHLHRHSS